MRFRLPTNHKWIRTLRNAHPSVPIHTARDWIQILASYREPSQVRSVFELAMTAGAFAGLWVLMWAALGFGYWLSLLLAVPAAGFLVRLFMIQHDCGHGAFFRRRAAQRLGGPRHRRADADALRRLAAQPCRPPRQLGQSRPARHRRHRHADGAGVPRLVALGPAAAIGSTATRSSCSGSVPPICSSCSTGCRSDRCAAPGSPGSAPWRPTLAIASGRRRHDVAGGRHAVPARAPADHAARLLDRRVAVLRPAPVRGHVSGRGRRPGACTRRRCTAARTTTCRASCAGSRPISACITCIISPAASRSIGCRACCATIPSFEASAGSRCGSSLACVRLVLWDEGRRRLISFRELRAASRAA